MATFGMTFIIRQVGACHWTIRALPNTCDPMVFELVFAPFIAAGVLCELRPASTERADVRTEVGKNMDPTQR